MFSTPLALLADQILDNFIQEQKGRRYPFLVEHFQYGLPRVQEIHALLLPLLPSSVSE